MMKPEGRKQSYNRTSTTNSRSIIFSDFSKAIYREEALQRKLRHLRDDNLELEKSIGRQQEQIKDQRTVIMYQMGELAKVVRNKMNVSDQLKIERSMFKDEEQAHCTIKQLMQKYESIQKEQKMILKVRQNLQKMNKTYEDHKESLRKIMQECNRSHQLTQQKMKNSIYEKKSQNQRTHQQNLEKQQKMHEMQEKMIQFEQQQENLQENEKKLKQQIAKEKQIIEERSKKIREMDRWEQIIIDKKKRIQLYEQLNRDSRVLYKVSERNREIDMRLIEERMFGRQLQNTNDKTL